MNVRWVWTIGLASLMGCGGLRPLTPTEVARIEAMPHGPTWARARVQVEIESPTISGTFEGVMITESGAQPKLRLQLFGDLGGMLLDITATRSKIAIRAGSGATALIEGDELVLSLPHRGDSPPRIVYLVTSLLEAFASLDLETITGMEERGDRLRLGRTPNGLGVSQTTALDVRGRPSVHHFQVYHHHWRLHLGEPLRLDGASFRLRLAQTGTEALDTLPRSVFGAAP